MIKVILPVLLLCGIAGAQVLTVAEARVDSDGDGKPVTWPPTAAWALTPVKSEVWPVALWGRPGTPRQASMARAAAPLSRWTVSPGRGGSGRRSRRPTCSPNSAETATPRCGGRGPGRTMTAPRLNRRIDQRHQVRISFHNMGLIF